MKREQNKRNGDQNTNSENKLVDQSSQDRTKISKWFGE